MGYECGLEFEWRMWMRILSRIRMWIRFRKEECGCRMEQKCGYEFEQGNMTEDGTGMWIANEKNVDETGMWMWMQTGGHMDEDARQDDNKNG